MSIKQQPADARPSPRVRLSTPASGVVDLDALPRMALLDDRQIAAIFGVTPYAVKSWRLLGRGGLEFVSLNGKARATVESVRKRLASLPRTGKQMLK